MKSLNVQNFRGRFPDRPTRLQDVDMRVHTRELPNGGVEVRLDNHLAPDFWLEFVIVPEPGTV